jgi:hypothetical protein
VAGGAVVGSSVGVVSSVEDDDEAGDSGGPSPSGSSSSLQPVTSSTRHSAAQVVHRPENTPMTIATDRNFPRQACLVGISAGISPDKQPPSP